MAKDAVWKVLIPEDAIQERIDEIAPQVQGWIDSQKGLPILAFVASGGIWFGMQLTSRLRPESYRYGLVGTSSYGNNEIGGNVDLSFNRTGDVKGRSVLLVDDIADRRRTLRFLADHFTGTQKAATYGTCVLLNKPSRKEVEVDLNFVGFEIPDTFVAGCGLDGGSDFEYTRNFPEVRFKKGTLEDTDLKFWYPK